jgi:hypothetical protein
MYEPTVNPPGQNGEPVDDQVDGETNGESRGVPGRKKRPKSRRRRLTLPQGVELRSCKFQLAKSVWQRIALEAVKKDTSESMIVNTLLDRHGPKNSITTQD